eukprot:14937898-Alexandrium_andersonii.AAC.1
MSASLVGSEMCIRDRASTVPRQARIEAQKGHIAMRWLDDLGAVLGLSHVSENNLSLIHI